jgi:predicted CXXCH cytochrome family protein
LPDISQSPFLNTKAGVGYVGSRACGQCHEEQETSFRRTGMGRSMALVDPGREPPNAVFDHPASKRRYEVQRRDGKLWHREFLLAEGAENVLLSEYPLEYVVGSGRHSLTYLVETDGFLVESPLTWYRSQSAWRMSPSYDMPEQPGFERAIGEGCLFCHAGRFEAIDRSLHRIHMIETAIGCESCHGPGALHVERRSSASAKADPPDEAVDYTIVNPSHLPRELAEAICQQCHLRSTASVVNRGRKVTDFRPGLPLVDFRQDYAFEAPDGEMTVVGHVEQMHQSACYKRSDDLTCLTCHNPHDEPPPAARVDYYQSICLTCHQAGDCQVDPARRSRESPDNDCVRCHMPSSPTDIPHLAFTHHRIGIHDRKTKTDIPSLADRELKLRPLLDDSRLSEIDRKRGLGLAYQEAANNDPDAAARARLGRTAFDLLSEVWGQGLRDGLLDSSWARLRFELRLDVQDYAESALGHPDIAGHERTNAMFLKAYALAGQGRAREARGLVRELTRLRRQSFDWVLLADCEKALGDTEAAYQALETAVRINPRLVQVHKELAEYYRRQGAAQRAEWHEQRAVP